VDRVVGDGGLIQNSDIDFVLETEKIEEVRKEVGLTKEQTHDIILQLIREQKEESLRQEREQYAYCPHCGKKVDSLRQCVMAMTSLLKP